MRFENFLAGAMANPMAGIDIPPINSPMTRRKEGFNVSTIHWTAAATDGSA